MTVLKHQHYIPGLAQKKPNTKKKKKKGFKIRPYTVAIQKYIKNKYRGI